MNSLSEGQDIRIILGRIIAILMTFQSSEVNAVSAFRRSLRSGKYIHKKCDSGIFLLEMVRNNDYCTMSLICESNWHSV